MSYRKFLRWNDELPFVKFALAADERPVLTSEIAVAGLDREAVGLAIARLLAVCDLLFDESLSWLWPGAKRAPVLIRPSRNEALLDQYAAQLAELSAPGELSGPGEGGLAKDDAGRSDAPGPGDPPREVGLADDGLGEVGLSRPTD